MPSSSNRAGLSSRAVISSNWYANVDTCVLLCPTVPKARGSIVLPLALPVGGRRLALDGAHRVRAAPRGEEPGTRLVDGHEHPIERPRPRRDAEDATGVRAQPELAHS